jgi:hypothetical protein
MFFAINLERAIVPDEPAHFALSRHYATTLGIPPDVPATYALGYIRHKPFLYYWLNGRVINAMQLLVPDLNNRGQLVTLRLLSTLYSTLTVLFCYLLSKEVFADRWWQVLPPFLLTNTLMFVFLSGGVNYDNLANLCVFASIYFLLRVLNRKPFYENSLYWLISISAGGLTERKALPLAFISGVVWLLFVLKNRLQIEFPPKWSWQRVGLLVVVILLFSLNFSIWGINLIRYRAFTPACTVILTEEQCLRSALERREQVIYLPNKVTYKEIMNGAYPDPLHYLLDFWGLSMLRQIYGIMGHKAYIPEFIITFYRLSLIWVAATAIRYWRNFPSSQIGSLMVIFLFHFITLFSRNYDTELMTGFKHIAIQGRYLFPVIGAAYVLLVYYVSQIQSTILRRVTVLCIILLFLWGGPAFLLLDLPPVFSRWFV